MLLPFMMDGMRFNMCPHVIDSYSSNIFTVANVGDSMCVLSRCGKAINIHKTHRVSDEDPAELERIKQAGGSVFNKR